MPTEAIKKEPCYAIVIYLIGVNDANMGKDGIYGRWLDGYQKIKSLREGRGKTLFVAATVPPQERRYFHDEADYPKISLVSNLNAQIRGDAKRKSESVREIIVELETISHSEYDDGLHFLSPGYSRIATNLCHGVRVGLGAAP
jgi:ribosomal protein L30E